MCSPYLPEPTRTVEEAKREIACTQHLFLSEEEKNFVIALEKSIERKQMDEILTQEEVYFFYKIHYAIV